MEEMIWGFLIFVTGVIFLWVSLFHYKWLYKGLKKFDQGKIDILPSLISDYWFWRIVFIGLGVLLIYITGNAFIRYVFFN